MKRELDSIRGTPNPFFSSRLRRVTRARSNGCSPRERRTRALTHRVRESARCGRRERARTSEERCRRDTVLWKVLERVRDVDGEVHFF